MLPASRLVDARQTLDRLADSLGDVLETMGAGLQQPWSTDQTEDWRRRARTDARSARRARRPRRSATAGRRRRWNVRDRRHIEVLGRYEEVMPRLERTAIGVSVISRGLDDHARLSGTTHPAMPAMGALLAALAGAVRALVHDVLAESEPGDLAARWPRCGGDGRGAPRGRIAGPGWPSSDDGPSTATSSRASGSATPPCSCRSTGSSAT